MPLLYQWLQDAVAAPRSAASIDGKSTASTAIVHRDAYISWRGLDHRVDRRAQELAAMGIGPGSWVGIMLGNVPDLVILALAASKLNAIVVLVDPTIANRDLDMVLAAAPLRALITRPGAEAQTGVATPTAPLRAGKPFKPRFVPESRRRLQGTLLTCSLYKRPPATICPDASVVLFTADAAGDPKGIVRTDAQLGAIASSIRATLGLGAEEQILCSVPLHQSYAFDFGLLAALASRSTLVLEDEIDAKALYRFLQDGITILPGTPSLYAAVSRLPATKPITTARTRFISSGSPLSPSVARNFSERLGAPVLSCYHTTETGPVAIDMGGNQPLTVGKAFDGVSIKVHANTAPASVWVKSDGTSLVTLPQATIKAKDGEVPVGHLDREGWIRTEDLGRLDERSDLTLAGREDDLVKVNGRRMALGEVEACLEGFAKVRTAAARIEVDDIVGPMVVVKVVSTGACRAQDLIDHCAKNLAPYKVPRHIEFCETLG